MAVSHLTRGSEHHKRHWFTKIPEYIKTGAETAMALKTMWDVGRSIYQVAQTAAPAAAALL